ncbi:MAG: lipopolysaccharide transport periplasmic protein LptA [Deltaproteobacteria bacterium]|nr:lipopolysaccharide transport periplasmic protein LptA [Deltaproteobacteria bacterium]
MERRKPGDSLWHWVYGLCLMVCFLIFVHSFAFAGEADPIFITSDRMEMDRTENTITYRGHVVTQQGELTMKSEALTAYYSPDMKGIKKIIAEGKVHVTQGRRVAIGAKAVFNGKDRTITFTGNPVLCLGKSQISGSHITFFIEQDRAVVEGGSKRVKAVIFPEELKGQEKGQPGPCKER